MKIVASLPPADIDALKQLLDKKQIPCEAKLTDEASGLDLMELLVSEDNYDEACEIIETFQQAKLEQSKSKFVRSCPKCGSKSWEEIDDAEYAKVGLRVFRCKTCGHLVPK